MDIDDYLPQMLFFAWAALAGVFMYIGRSSLRRRVLDRIAIYGSRHEWRETSVLEYPKLKLGFYDECQAELEGCGFKVIGDIEDVTLAGTRENPHTFRRVMISPDKKILAEFWRVNYSPWKQLLHMLGKGLGDASFIRVFSESTNGRIFCVMRAPVKVRGILPDNFDVRYVEGKPSADEVWARFAGDYAEFARVHPDFEPLTFSFLDGVLLSEERQQDAVVSMRKRIGLLTREELLGEGMSEKHVDSYLKAFSRQLRKLGGWPKV